MAAKDDLQSSTPKNSKTADFSPIGHRVRTLTAEEVRKLNEDKEMVNEFKQMKFEQDAKKHWDQFYLRNEARFFKDRHWTIREFQELLNTSTMPGEKNVNADLSAIGATYRPVLLEVGCGVGNMVLPLLEEDTRFQVLACDFSPRAVALLSTNPIFIAKGGRAFVCDLTTSTLLEEVRPDSVDVVTLIFMLSAVHPNKMPIVLDNLFKVLQPGGVVLFRDYGLYDQAQLRFKKGHKLQENFYVRQDGTRVYYFSEEAVRTLFENSGFLARENSYICRRTINRKEGIDVPRVFVQSKFVKPFLSVKKSTSITQGENGIG
ncbi:methyltransferase-like protein 6 [Varroa jacobsoni]|uniref:tRNA N(3)-methylcytidine methyltransferase n=1 Tax=Varroa destructor TaxID=109461 RepID=A0A7M7MCJ4_VARDE|nr:methyltransferase-like protein 6 [Varroa destructor]XP_022711095.1 methyltransferase-like protein 6 [Varroa jacobsoni]